MKKGLASMVFGLIVSAALATNAPAQMGGCMGECGEMGHGRMMKGMGGMQDDKMMDQDHGMWNYLMSLGIDDKQKEQLKALHSKTMKDMARRRAEIQVAGIELKDLLDRDPVDMKAVEAAAKKKSSLKTEMFLAHLRAHEEMKSILTPDQRKRLKEMTGGGGCIMGGSAEHKDMPKHEHMH